MNRIVLLVGLGVVAIACSDAEATPPSVVVDKLSESYFELCVVPPDNGDHVLDVQLGQPPEIIFFDDAAGLEVPAVVVYEVERNPFGCYEIDYNNPGDTLPDSIFVLVRTESGAFDFDVEIEPCEPDLCVGGRAFGAW